jgi:hypothetical protein
VEFRNYRKFSADTSVNFDDPEAQPLLNEDKTKGQAAPKQ